jgi:hypothetical protein
MHLQVCQILDNAAQRFLRSLCSAEELGIASPYALFPMLDCHPWAPKRNAASSLDAFWSASEGGDCCPSQADSASHEIGFVAALYSTSNSIQVRRPPWRSS